MLFLFDDAKGGEEGTMGEKKVLWGEECNVLMSCLGKGQRGENKRM